MQRAVYPVANVRFCMAFYRASGCQIYVVRSAIKIPTKVSIRCRLPHIHTFYVILVCVTYGSWLLLLFSCSNMLCRSFMVIMEEIMTTAYAANTEYYTFYHRKRTASSRRNTPLASSSHRPRNSPSNSQTAAVNCNISSHLLTANTSTLASLASLCYWIS